MPKLYSASGSMKKQWFVFFSYRNPVTGKMERFKDSDGFGALKSREERIAHGNNLIAYYRRKLRSGWNPFEDSSILFEDDLIKKKPKTSRDQIEPLLFNALQSITTADRSRSIDNYKLYIRYFLEFITEKGLIQYDLDCVTEEVAQQFLDQLITHRRLSNKSHNETLSLLKRLFAHLQRKRKISHNPFHFLKNKKHYKAARPFYPDHLRTKIVEDVQSNDPLLFLFISLTYYLMRRKTELTEIRLGHVNFEQGIIELPGNITKQGTPQTVDIPRQLMDILIDMQLHRYPKDYYLVSPSGVPSQKKCGKNFFYKRWLKFRNKYGLTNKYGVYSWKHTASVSMKLAGFDLMDIKDHGGWSSISMLDNYMSGFSIKGSDKIQNHFPDITFSTRQSLRPAVKPKMSSADFQHDSDESSSSHHVQPA